MINWDDIRNDFPILKTTKKGYPLAYLDNGATSQKPQVVIDAIKELYETTNANIHRGVYELSEKTTALYEQSKHTVASFIHAPSWENIIYTKNTTEGLNVAALMLEHVIQEGDEILISLMEHHSNLIPWMQIAKRKHAKLVYLSVTKNGELSFDEFKQKVASKTKVLAMSHVSNVLGTVNDVSTYIEYAKTKNIYTVIDGAQAVGHMPVDITALDPDFYAFSGHKMLGPTGIGVLYMKKSIAQQFDPVFFGGDMIKHVEQYTVTYNDLPWKFEAGTSNYEGGIALGAAVKYLSDIGIEEIQTHVDHMATVFTKKLKELHGSYIYGESEHKVGIVSFAIDGIHPHDLASVLDSYNVCIRAGHHCAEPLVTSLGQIAIARASFYLYNNEQDIEQCIMAIKEAQKLFTHG